MKKWFFLFFMLTLILSFKAFGSSEKNYENAIKCWGEQNYYPAIHFINKALNDEPENSEYLLLKGRLLYLTGQDSGALKILNKTLSLNPKGWVLQWTYIELGKINLAKENYTGAKQCFQNAVNTSGSENAKKEALFYLNLPNVSWLKKESKHFAFYYEKGDEISSADMKKCEEHYNVFTEFFGIKTDKKIKYYKYINPDRKEQLTGFGGYGKVMPYRYELHSAYSFHPHEITHILSITIGNPPAMMAEGLAVLYGWKEGWQGKPFDFWVKEYIKENKLLPLEEISKTVNFRKYPEDITYPEAASFLEFLIKKYGVEKFKAVYKNADEENIDSAFKKIYGKNLKELEKEWKKG